MQRKHKDLLKRRSLDPDLYEFVKETYTSVYFRHILTRKIKIIDKGARFN